MLYFINSVVSNYVIVQLQYMFRFIPNNSYLNITTITDYSRVSYCWFIGMLCPRSGNCKLNLLSKLLCLTRLLNCCFIFIRYARASSNYSDFLKRHLHLRNRLLDQGYKKIRLIRSLKKFIFRYQDLVEIYSVSAETMINDAFSYSENV